MNTMKIFENMQAVVLIPSGIVQKTMLGTTIANTLIGYILTMRLFNSPNMAC